MSKILALPDLHVPWTNFELLKEVADFVKHYKPDRIIQLGDITDQKAWSRFGLDPDDLSPSIEWEQTVEGMTKLHKLFPNLTILLGNHDTRAITRALGAGVPKELVRELKDVFNFKGWNWHVNNTPLIIDGVAYVHGDELAGNSPATKAITIGRSVVYGHTHQAKLEFRTSFDNRIFGMECGCIIDETGYGFRYAAKAPKRCTMAFGTVEDGEQPHLYIL